MVSFKEKILEVVKRIPSGKFLSYKEVAKKAGNEKAVRVVGNILAKNKDLKIPCHRVIKSDYTMGGYFGSHRNSWLKVALLLKEGTIGVIPTDTIYGICGSVFNKKTVERIYKLRKRTSLKPLIILISSLDDLKIFGVKLKPWQKKILIKIWPSPTHRQAKKISVILSCPSSNFSYLHKGTKTLAFRIPAKRQLWKIINISGPLVAPSANLEGFEPAKTIFEARRYFGGKVFYYGMRKLKGPNSTLINLIKNPMEVIRRGADYQIINKLINDE